MTIEEAKDNGWICEDQLPTISTQEYNLWYSYSEMIDGIRMGPKLKELLPTDLINIKLSLVNSGEQFIEMSIEGRKYLHVKGEDYTFIEIPKKTGFIKMAFDHDGKMNSINFYING